MISLVYFAGRLPSQMSDELTHAGFRVFEALAISEVLHLSETEKPEIVVIAADVDDRRAKVIQESQTALRLTPATKTSELIAELWGMFPDKVEKVQ
jgi:hypothetical protein